MMEKETKMIYLGRFTNNNKLYEVIEDQTNEIINIFFKNYKNSEVECWSLRKSEIEKVRGKEILDKTKNYWYDLSNYSLKKMKSLVFLQVFPLEFWVDIVLPIKKGEQDSLLIQFEDGMKE